MNKEKLKTFRIVDINDLAQEMINNSIVGKDSTAITFYDDAVKLTKSILQNEDVTIIDMDISEPLFNGYDSEYYVALNQDFELFVEPAMIEDGKRHSDKYLCDISDCVYIMDGVSKDIYDYLSAEEGHIVINANNSLSGLIDEYLSAETYHYPGVYIHIIGG